MNIEITQMMRVAHTQVIVPEISRPVKSDVITRARKVAMSPVRAMIDPA